MNATEQEKKIAKELKKSGGWLVLPPLKPEDTVPPKPEFLVLDD
jgi:hypothetical protein